MELVTNRIRIAPQNLLGERNLVGRICNRSVYLCMCAYVAVLLMCVEENGYV